MFNDCNMQCNPGLIPGPAPTKCRTVDCTKLRTFRLPANLGTDETGRPYAPKLGAYHNAIVIYEANGAVYIYDDEGIYTSLSGEEALETVEALQEQVTKLVTNVDELNANISQNAENISQNTKAITKNTEAIAKNTEAINQEAEKRVTGDKALAVQLQALETTKQDVLVSGSNIKTINGQSVLGNGDLTIEASGAEVEVSQTTGNSTTAVMSQNAVTNELDKINDSLSNIDGSIANPAVSQVKLSSTGNQLLLNVSGKESDTSSVTLKTINGNSIVGSGDVTIVSKPLVEFGVIPMPINPNTGGTLNRSFKTAFTSPPVVFLQINTLGQSIVSDAYEKLRIWVGNVTSTGFSFRYMNGSSTSWNTPDGVAVDFMYAAIGN